MINEVFIVGKVISASERDNGKVLDLLVENKRYYGYGENASFSTNVHNVYLVSNTETTKKFIDNSTRSKHPTYIGVYGLMAERNLEPLEGSDKKYGPSQQYILGTKVLQLSNELETSECRAYFQGDIVWKDTSYNQKGTPMTKMIVKQSRQRKSKDGEEYTAYTAIPVTVFREGIEVPFEKGDTAVFAGSLDSYEMRDYPGVYTSSMTSFDYAGAPVSRHADEEQAPAPARPTVSTSTAPTPSSKATESFPETDLPF